MTKCYANASAQFINIPKNASTSILTQMFSLQGQSVEEVHRHARGWASDWRPNGPPSFTVLRHPWRRFVSMWKNKIWQPHAGGLLLHQMGAPVGAPLDEFCQWFLALDESEWYRETHMRCQWQYLPDKLDGITVLVQEDLAVGWERAGLEALFGRLPELNSTRGVDYTYDPKYRSRVEEVYKKDMDLWSKNIS